MNKVNQNEEQEGSRWLRVGLLTLTLLGPIIKTIAERMRQRSQALQDTTLTAQMAARQRLDELTQASRQVALEQAQQLQEQARQLQAQALQLRAALSENTEQSLKVAEQMRKAGEEWSRELMKRGSKVTHDLAERSSKVARDLAERSEDLLEPVRKRDGAFWTVLGFSVGLTAAVVATYLFVRQRILQQATEENQQIELPQNGYRSTTEREAPARPATTE
jgi:uncharacterized phage infection (PIP) family protein YhgE